MKITVITISYNSSSSLEQTIGSVLQQTWIDKEYIIIDGGSTDGTVELIKQFDDEIDYWVSEPDKGIADAMNKGISYATGDYIIFLHSDDFFVNDTVLSDAVSHLTSRYEIYLFAIFLSNNGKNRLYKPRGFNWWMNFKTGIAHQSTICSQKLFSDIGIFDTKFKIAMDYDFFLRAYRANKKLKKINFPLSVMRLCGVSSQVDWPSLKARFIEEREVHLKNNSLPLFGIVYFLYWSLYIPYRYCKTNFFQKI